MNHLHFARLAALGAVLVLASACHRDTPKPEGHAEHAATAASNDGKPLADVQPDGTTAPLLHGIGPLHVPISTKSEQAQKYFDQGFTLMYGFNHAEAIRSFKEAARIDPTCAICWWGVALSYGPNINAPMEKAAVPEAWKALQTAQSLRANASPREQAYIDAVAARYSESGEGRAQLDRAYADAMAKLVAAYPDDLDAATLYAESLMDLMPWDYYEKDGKTPKPDTVIAIAQIERVIKANPEHPGALHFYIHAVEATPTPERAEAAADALGDLVPVAGHLVHMPAHIYLRVGRYHDAVTQNELAATADEDYIAQCNAQGFYPAVYYPHNLHFLWYAAMMEGQQKLSLDTARKMAQHVPLDFARTTPEVQQYVPVPIYTLVRFGLWDDMLAEPAPPDGVPFATAMWHFGRGFAYARKGDIPNANAELKFLQAAADLGATVKIQGKPEIINGMVAVATDLVTAAIANAHGDHASEVAALERAVKAQDALQYTEPPYWFYPVRQSLGAAYLRAKRPVDAQRVFEEDLAYFKNNGWSLWGLSEAVAAQGKDASKTRAEQQIAWQYADIPAAQVLN
jgi:tetratricopeptide (TPR) repeat protein